MLGYSSDGELIGEGGKTQSVVFQTDGAQLASYLSLHSLGAGCLIDVPPFGRQGDVAHLLASHKRILLPSLTIIFAGLGFNF